MTNYMKNIENLERKKAEIVADHVKRCNIDEDLSIAEKWVLKELDYEINRLKKKQRKKKV